MEEFITVPRGVNKTDAMSLVSSFGSVRTAVNANPEEVLLVAGWGEKKVQRWCNTVREPFRIRKAAKRGIMKDGIQPVTSKEASRVGNLPRADEQNQAVGSLAASDVSAENIPSRPAVPRMQQMEHQRAPSDEELALLEASGYDAPTAVPTAAKAPQVPVSDGIAAALARLRKDG